MAKTNPNKAMVIDWLSNTNGVKVVQFTSHEESQFEAIKFTFWDVIYSIDNDGDVIIQPIDTNMHITKLTEAVSMLKTAAAHLWNKGY